MSDDSGQHTGASPVTSRGAKYWDSAAIPLIAPEILGDIISEVSDIGLVISETGKVLSVLVNPTNTDFSDLDIVDGQDIRTALTVESVRKFDARLAAYLSDDGPVRPIELNHKATDTKPEFPVRYSFHRIGAGGAVLLLGRDLRPIAEMQQQLVKAQLALERDYEAQREFNTRFKVLMDNTREAVAFVSASTGEITEANPVAAHLMNTKREVLIGSQLSAHFAKPKRGDLVDTLASTAMTDPGSVTKTICTATNSDVQILPTVFRAAGERILLCLISSADSEIQQVDDLSRNIRGLYHNGPDAIVFALSNGEILSANEAFLNLIDAAHDADLRGRNLADYLQRGGIDLKVMTENAGRAGSMRSYATKMAGDYGSPRAVELSATELAAGTHQIFAFVIRAAGQSEPLRPSMNPTSDENLKSAVELVGSASLKDIVAETTNVVEKMCIETAVELTMNNRVAAAEMLGLSRQSLYVKLRKFDLLNRDGKLDE
ncbi:transcriptional regulator PpsR [Yoonia sediminilitoris]|uniref:transcriptional regulator PpsR n=1 Tax=Yoonia sediminilitoris TaxID=1286148 RepID=UPI001FE72BFD|nr:transcriptional regulator PpsR [Yoonia sediminilitoris]